MSLNGLAVQRLRAASLALAAAIVGTGAVTAAPDADIAALRSHDAALATASADSAFGAPLQIESSEAPRAANGSVYARLPHEYAKVAVALQRPAPWCEILILHLNVKGCEARAATVTIYVGSKHEQPLKRAYRLELRHTLDASGPDYMRVRLEAPDGPLDTRETSLLVEAMPAQAGGTLIHFDYAIAYGALSHLAMHGYLATVGRDKIGFSSVPSPGSTGTVPVQGARGVVERNAMRYYLAIEAYLDSLALAPSDQHERRLSTWFDATQRYRAQLHEVERDEYLAMKRREMAPVAR